MRRRERERRRKKKKVLESISLLPVTWLAVDPRLSGPVSAEPTLAAVPSVHANRGARATHGYAKRGGGARCAAGTRSFSIHSTRPASSRIPEL